MGGEPGRGHPRGGAARVRAAGARHHACAAQDSQGGQRARGPALRRPGLPRQVDPGPGQRRAPVRRPARRTCARASPSPGRRTRRWSASPTRPAPGSADTEPDLRGVALRVQVSPEEVHDLLMTNYPVSHARSAYQFVEFAKATAGGRVSRVLGLLKLVRLFGLHEVIRMLRNVMTGRKRTVTSVATETYWSRGAMRWGPDLAVRYLLRPAPDTAPAPPVPKGDPNYLSTEAGRPARRRTGALRALHPALPRREVDADRGHRCRVEGERVPSRAGGRPDAAPGRHHHRRRSGAGADHRHDGVQPVEHDRRVPSARAT